MIVTHFDLASVRPRSPVGSHRRPKVNSVRVALPFAVPGLLLGPGAASMFPYGATVVTRHLWCRFRCHCGSAGGAKKESGRGAGVT